MKPVLFGGALLAALGASIVETPAADGLRMRYGLKPGKSYEQTLTLNLALAFDPQSTPEALLSLLRTLAGDVRQEVATRARIEVATPGADGRLPFSYQVLEAHGTLTRAGEARPIPSIAEAAGKPPTEGNLAADRRRVTLEEPEAGNAGLPARVRERLAESLPILPEGELHPGDSFEVSTTLSLPGLSGKGEQRREARWTYTLRTLDGKEATFDVVQRFPEAATVTLAGGNSLEMSGGGTGRAVWSRAEGAFTSLRIDTDLSIDVDLPLPSGLTLGTPAAPGGGAAAPGAPAGTPVPTRIRTRVTGPLVMTLAPAAAR